ncbi:hypothetical protein Y032_0120g954 [Ancylostoma ceylanicum]|uniref:Uncharacterized protein n=1 Tax=Ancylostoma ceylanicum TaxID=53326 RepID=A0A016TAW4_9BILA|nr:hypothetical protein Y032_0120g954 [Ancylostoma ceylanicum]
MYENVVNFDFYLYLQVFRATLVMFKHVKFSSWPTVVFTTVGMNEISPDSIKGMGRVGCLYIEEEEPGRRRWTRMRGERALPQ